MRARVSHGAPDRKARPSGGQKIKVPGVLRRTLPAGFAS